MEFKKNGNKKIVLFGLILLFCCAGVFGGVEEGKAQNCSSSFTKVGDPNPAQSAHLWCLAYRIDTGNCDNLMPGCFGFSGSYYEIDCAWGAVECECSSVSASACGGGGGGDKHCTTAAGGQCEGKVGADCITTLNTNLHYCVLAGTECRYHYTSILNSNCPAGTPHCACWDQEACPSCTAVKCASDGCASGAVCGNNTKETGEDCDGTDLDGKDCTDFPPCTGGTLACSACSFDTSSCTGCAGAVCGNNIKEVGESCDGTDLDGKDCTDFGCTGGTLACSSCNFETSSCTGCGGPPPPPPTCGDGTIGAGEICDPNASPTGCGVDETCVGCTLCQAGGGGSTVWPVTFTNPLDAESFEELIASVINWLLAIVGSIVLLFIIIAGIMYMTAAGDEAQLTRAKKMLFYTILGFAIILISYSLIKEIKDILGITS